MNTAEALHIACLLGIPLADGDPGGPLCAGTVTVHFLSQGTAKRPDGRGHKVWRSHDFLKDMIDDFRIETLVRSIATVSGDDISVCDHPTDR